MNYTRWREVEMRKTIKHGQFVLRMVVTTWSQSGSTWGLVSGRTETQTIPRHQQQEDSAVKLIKPFRQFRAGPAMATKLRWMEQVLPQLQQVSSFGKQINVVTLSSSK